MAENTTLSVRMIGVDESAARGSDVVQGIMTVRYEPTAEELAYARENPNESVRIVEGENGPVIEEDFTFRSGGGSPGAQSRVPGTDRFENRNEALPGLLPTDDRDNAGEYQGRDVQARYDVTSQVSFADNIGSASFGEGNQFTIRMQSRDNVTERGLNAAEMGAGQTGAFCIHPDGGGLGTSGCIGVTQENGDDRRFEELYQRLQSSGRTPSELVVLEPEVDEQAAERYSEMLASRVFDEDRVRRYDEESRTQLNRLQDEFGEAMGQNGDMMALFAMLIQLFSLMVNNEESASIEQGGQTPAEGSVGISDQLRDVSLLNNQAVHRIQGQELDGSGLSALNVDGDQTLSYGEVVAGYDQDGSGRLDNEAEIAAIAEALGSSGVQMDASQDGQLDLSELRAGLEGFVQRDEPDLGRG